jgi:heptosyltransferase-3
MKFNTERGNSRFRFLDRYIGIPIIFALGLLKKRNKILPDSIKKVAFLKTAGIGDTVLLSAVIRGFKDAYPSAWLTFFVASNNYEMAQMISGIDTIIKLPLVKPLECIHIVKESGEYDIWIDFGPWPRINALLSYFSNARFKVGFKTKGQYRHYIYDLTAEHSAHLHELDNYKNLLKQLGLNCHNSPCVNLHIPECSDNRITIHMFPGGSRSYLKQWPDANWIEIIDQLTARNYEVFLTGAKIDCEKAEQIKAQIKNRGSVNIVAGELDLKQTAELLKSSTLVISVDTGIMHLASALGCNLIALHGPTSVKRWGPLGANAISLQSGLQCSPCLNLGFESKCQTNSCMKFITTKALMDAAKKMIPFERSLDLSLTVEYKIDKKS